MARSIFKRFFYSTLFHFSFILKTVLNCSYNSLSYSIKIISLQLKDIILRTNSSRFSTAILCFFTIISISGCKTEKPALLIQKAIAPEPPKKEVVISFITNPKDFIKDNFGYTGIEYFTKEQVIEKIKTRLEKKNAPAEDYTKTYKKVPDFGNIILHIGRQDLMHANTKWYTCTVKNGKETHLSWKGKEGIPNIKGRDGNWWNTVKLPVKKEIADKLYITVKDNKTGDIYSFRILKIETVVSP